MKKALLILAAVLLLAALSAPIWVDRGLRLLYPRDYRQLVEREAAEFELPTSLVYAVIRTESGFDADALSQAGAQGLMQLTPATYEWICELYPMPGDARSGAFDPEANVHCGCALLRRLLDHYGDRDVALCAYNAGMGNVSGWLQDPRYSADGRTLTAIPFTETRNYVRKVDSAQRMYRRLYGET